MKGDITSETVAAVATARGSAAISVIRISGPGAFGVLDAVFRPANAAAGDRRLVTGRLADPKDGAAVDSVLAARFPAPASYTGEDMAEIHTHGGIFVTGRAFELVIANGARPALPGEFTLRAFVNGKIDLTQAEAVNDVINARNEHFLRAAMKALGGEFGAKVRMLRNRLISLLARIEVVIEYPDEDTPEIPSEDIRSELSQTLAALELFVAGYRAEQSINHGPKIALIGRPNVGKSSLMKQLLGRERSIIHETPGTTRDLVGDLLHVSGLDVLIMDTAGITDSSDPVEREGVKRTMDFIETADEVFLLLDGSKPMSQVDVDLAQKLKDSDKKFIIIINKSDLECKLDESEATRLGTTYRISALTGDGMDGVFEHIESLAAATLDGLGETIITNARHKDLLDIAAGSLRDALANIGSMPQDILTIDVRSAANSLGLITGEDTTRDILDNIFSNFCIGK